MKLQVSPKGCLNLKSSQLLIVSNEIISPPGLLGKVTSTWSPAEFHVIYLSKWWNTTLSLNLYEISIDFTVSSARPTVIFLNKIPYKWWGWNKEEKKSCEAIKSKTKMTSSLGVLNLNHFFMPLNSVSVT